MMQTFKEELDRISFEAELSDQEWLEAIEQAKWDAYYTDGE